MRKWWIILCSLLFTLPAWADTNVEALLNSVMLQLSAEQWVTTKTALVTVGMNASVSDNDLGKTQNQILDKLKQIASDADWHMISFDRSLDQSGLEKIQASAQARLASAALAGLRDKVKAMSKPGVTFTLDNVQFIPSEDEVRAANAALRNQIYQQAKTELDQLNKLYPEQKYYLHQVNFISELMPRAMPQNAMLMQVKMAAPAMLQVGDKLRLSAVVILSSAPSADVVKLMHN